MEQCAEAAPQQRLRRAKGMFAGGCQRERLAAALLGYRLALDQCRVREAGEELGDGWLETPARRASSVPETPSRAIAHSARY